MGKRFLNYLLDTIFYYILTVIVGIILGATTSLDAQDPSHSLVFQLIGVVLLLLYFIVTEGIWGKTPAKFITGTKVVTVDGSKPTWGRIIGRSFARIIPFDALSFLTRKHPVGWHDHLSKTYVVPKDYTPEDVSKIDRDSDQKVGAWIIVVVILVVIAITGLMSTLAIVALGNARTKSRDAKRQSDIAQIQTALELYYLEQNSYPTSLDGLGMYMPDVPTDPSPTTNNCGADGGYQYEFQSGGAGYELSFCLEEEHAPYTAGLNTVTNRSFDY